jgi:hypothetical protein
VARDDGTLRERYLAAIEGEIIAARIRLERARERMGDHMARDERIALVEDTLAALETDRERLRAGEAYDEDEARALLEPRRTP